jgi:secreted trypsin-like serine protease
MKSCVASRAIPAVMLLSALGCAGSPGDADQPGSDQAVGSLGDVSEPLVGGTTDTTDKAVLAVVSQTASQVGLCTGTLIAPNLVLTARHCIESVPEGSVDCSTTKFTPPASGEQVAVSTSTSLQQRNASFYQVSEVHVPPNGNTVCGDDIALLVLAKPFPASVLQPIAVQLDVPVAKGDPYTAVGFGVAEQAGSEGTRRAKTGQAVVCASESCAARGLMTSTEFVGADSICEGDSGGPAIDSSGSVIGIVSRGADNCGLAIYSAVAPWGSWIETIAQQAAQTGNYTMPAWFSPNGDQGSSAVAASDPSSSTGAGAATPSGASGAAQENPATGGAVGPAIMSPTSHASAGGCALVATGGAEAPLPMGMTLLAGVASVIARRRSAKA